MGILRIFLSIFMFFFSCYCVYDLIVSDFDWLIFWVVIFGFISVHFIWPDTSKIDSSQLDVVEFLIEIPFHIIASIPRSIVWFLKNIDL